MFDTVYDASRRRTCAVATALTAGQLETVVPATPDWTARELLAHLAGVASDAVHGRLTGLPSPEQTAAQVRERAGRTLDEVLAEWAQAGPQVCQALAARRASLRIVHDVLTHEADLREAFGLGRLPDEAVAAVLGMTARAAVQSAAGDGALLVHVDGQEFHGGSPDAEPTVLRIGAYELYRGLLSRRARVQMRAWAWSGPEEAVVRHVDALPVFGPREDEQPIP